jgi:hypothetical protein
VDHFDPELPHLYPIVSFEPNINPITKKSTWNLTKPCVILPRSVLSDENGHNAPKITKSQKTLKKLNSTLSINHIFPILTPFSHIDPKFITNDEFSTNNDDCNQSNYFSDRYNGFFPDIKCDSFSYIPSTLPAPTLSSFPSQYRLLTHDGFSVGFAVNPHPHNISILNQIHTNQLHFNDAKCYPHPVSSPLELFQSSKSRTKIPISSPEIHHDCIEFLERPPSSVFLPLFPRNWGLLSPKVVPSLTHIAQHGQCLHRGLSTTKAQKLKKAQYRREKAIVRPQSRRGYHQNR